MTSFLRKPPVRGAYAGTRTARWLLALLALVAGAAHAGPDQVKGATPWVMVMCTYPGVGVRPDWQANNFGALFVPGTGGLTDYFRDVSYGTIDISGSRVYGWFTLPYDPPEAQRVLGKDASIAAGSKTLVSPNAHFHASDVGKEVWIPGVLPPHTTITSLVPYVDSTVGLSDAALTAASAVDVKITRSRETLLEDCLHAAEPQVQFPNFYGVIAMRNDTFDSDSTGRQSLTLNGQRKTYGAMLLSDAGLGLNVTHIAHEMLHGYGLQHSYGDPAAWCPASGVYCDPWDIMSAMTVNAFSGTFGMSSGMSWRPFSGPGMNAGMLDLMGWLQPGRRWVWNGPTAANVQLAPLSHPEWYGTLGAVIPLPDSPSHYYIVELRAADRWDRGFALTDTSVNGYTTQAWSANGPPGRVFVHEVKIGDDGQPHSWIKKGYSSNCVVQYDLPPGGFFRDITNGVAVEVASIATDASSAMITMKQASPEDASVCAPMPAPTPTGYSGGTGSMDTCTTCGPGGKTPPRPIHFE